MAFGRRGGRRFKEKYNLCQKGCACKGMAVANAQDGMGKNEPWQAHHASMRTFLSDRRNAKIVLEKLGYTMC